MTLTVIESRSSEDWDVRCICSYSKVKCHCHVTVLCKLYLDFWMRNSCYANKSDPHHLSLNQIEQKFSVVNKSEKIRPSHLVWREGGGVPKSYCIAPLSICVTFGGPKAIFFLRTLVLNFKLLWGLGLGMIKKSKYVLMFFFVLQFMYTDFWTLLAFYQVKCVNLVC